MFALQAIVLFIGRRYREVVASLPSQPDLHIRILQGPPVPGPGPEVRRHEELVVAVEAGQDPVVRVAIRIRGGDDQRGLTLGLENPDHGREHGDQAPVSDEHDQDHLYGFWQLHVHSSRLLWPDRSALNIREWGGRRKQSNVVL